jgi:uncharacterized protein YcbX
MFVSELYFYPVKSCAGVKLTSAQIGQRGIIGDRLWMVVNEKGKFLTQRELPRMALIEPRLSNAGTLSLNAPGMPTLEIQPRSLASQAPTQVVKIWNDDCQAIDEGQEAAQWFSCFLKKTCRLVRMADAFKRQVDQKYAPSPDNEAAFQDGFPFLLISQESLLDLNQKLDDPLDMNRFRPNIVISGCQPFAEDKWQSINIGSITFDIVKPCARCVITTIEQTTGLMGSEPLKTLSSYRLKNGKVLFGQNLTYRNIGHIALGDEVIVSN